MRALARVGTRNGLFLVVGNAPRGSRQADGPRFEYWGVSRTDATVSGG